MKPDWDKLMELYNGNEATLVADVDCTAEGKDLCSDIGVRGYPTIKYGDPNDLQDYNGGRDFNALKAFADGLGPQCGPAHIDLCSEEKKKMIEEFTALSSEQREEKIAEMNKQIEDLEAGFKEFLDGLNKQYTEYSEKKDKDIEAIKESGLGLLKSVNAHVTKTAQVKDGAEL
jgi:hypothetical protein